jgi:selenocysteine lyase/cysteine desulfurase
MLGAFEYLADLGGSEQMVRPALHAAMHRIQSHERALAARLIDGLQQMKGVQIYGITDPERLDRRAPTVSLTWSPHRPEDLARWLGRHNVFTTHSDHYATELINRLGLVEQGGTLRIGVAHYNTASEVDLVLELLAGYRP